MDNGNNISDNNKSNSSFGNKRRLGNRTNFNKVVGNAVKKVELKNGKRYNKSKSKYQTEKDYQNSFAVDMGVFEKTINAKAKKDINAIIFHDSNNDGIVSAYVAWKFIQGGAEIKYYPLRPGHSVDVDKRIQNILGELRGKNVLILDLDYNRQTLEAIMGSAKSLLIIDDHAKATRNAVGKVAGANIFIGENHAVVAYAWKFFFPKEDVPRIIQYVDNSDAKLFLPYLPFSNLFNLSLGFRYVHNIFKRAGPQMFRELDELFGGDNPNLWIFIGKYYDEVWENMKMQIANNARMVNFQGYRVGVLNFNAPSLTKVVGRQILTNLNRDRPTVDFAVLWGYEYSANPPAFRVTLIDDHKQTKINMGAIAREMAKQGRHPKGGGGHDHEGQFYWARDIWELFEGGKRK